MDKVLCHSVISSDDAPTIDKNSVDPFGDSSGKALWKLDGNGTDVSGVYSMTAGTPSWVTGLDGQCASLTGATSQILYRGVELLLQLSNHSFCGWIKTNAIGVTQFLLDNQFKSSGSGSTSNGGVAIRISTTGFIEAVYLVLNNETYTDSNGNTSTSYNVIAKSSFAITAGQWYHISYVMNGNNLKLYIDGVLNCQVTSVQSIRWSASSTAYGRLALGGWAENSSIALYYPLNGLVEQCRILNRVLTPTEITALYNEI